VNDARGRAESSPTGGSREREAVTERKLGSNGDGARYGGNGVIILRRLPEESPASFVFKGAVHP